MVRVVRGSKTVHPCPECGSEDTELVRPEALGRWSVFGKMLDLLDGPGPRQGQYVLVCHKCGYRSVIFFQ